MTQIVMYAHPACPQVAPMMAMLKQSKVPYTYINIYKDAAARQRLREINQGYESVPTFEFPDGSTLTEPGSFELQKKLETLGYRVPLYAHLSANAFTILTALIIIYAIISALQ